MTRPRQSQQDSTDSKTGILNPEVFIAYSHDSDQHKQRVLELANRLVGDGVNCNLDRYEKSPPEGWPEWSRRKINESNYVLVICTQTYHRRVSGKEQPGIGRGAKWEGMIITQTIFDADAKNYKFIPVVLDSIDLSFIPEFLSGATHYDLNLPDGYNNLYRHITSQPAVIKPPLGKLKTMPPIVNIIGGKDSDILQEGQVPALVSQLSAYAPDVRWSYLMWKIQLTFISPSIKLSISDQQRLIDDFYRPKNKSSSYIRCLFHTSSIDRAAAKHVLQAESDQHVTNYRKKIQLEIGNTEISSICEYASVNGGSLLEIKDVIWQLSWLFILARQAASQAQSKSINMDMKIISNPNPIGLNSSPNDPLEDGRAGYGQNEKMICIEKKFTVSGGDAIKDVEAWLFQLLQDLYEHYPYKSDQQWRVPRVDKVKLSRIVKDKFESFGSAGKAI